jgi:formate hydrogenlyase subunit 3/multisubunit Na+/H+ antiporter MnhD subunit
VTFEHEKAEVRSAGLTYLVATHLGTAFLLVMFAILGREAGSLDFDRFGALEMLAPATASIIFVSAVVGFGAKAGFVPMHVWLPEAHPAAPSHVSALMSGVMIKIGIYGILRALTFLDSPPVWWGVMLIGIGITSGVFGVVFALAQRDLKRLLAYSSVENIGIITLGMGVGLLAVSRNMDTVAVLAFAGSALHVMNHAAFKGLLFLGAGSVLHATEQRDMDRQGGLIKRMPITGFTFLVSAAAIAGLPPLNGFVSEFLIFLGALNGSLNNDVITSVSLIGVIAGLGLIGGLAVACFTRAFGIVFLGTPRTDAATHAHEGGPGFRIPMLVLAAVCVLIGVFPLVSMRIVAPVASQISGVPVEAAESLLTGSASPLIMVTIAAFVVIGFSALLVLLRTALLARKEVGASVTWDCGYELPTARMQYTSSSFAQPLLRIFRQLLGIRVRLHAAEGYFPARASFYSDAPDVFTDRMYQPAVVMLEWVSLKLRWFQHGRVHIYLLYIFVTLLVLMIWKLGF